jgi:hypothetical protein
MMLSPEHALQQIKRFQNIVAKEAHDSPPVNGNDVGIQLSRHVRKSVHMLCIGAAGDDIDWGRAENLISQLHCRHTKKGSRTATSTGSRRLFFDIAKAVKNGIEAANLLVPPVTKTLISFFHLRCTMIMSTVTKITPKKREVPAPYTPHANAKWQLLVVRQEPRGSPQP